MKKDPLLRDVANILKSSIWCVALTGAGISVESGIPPFRGKRGIWSRYDPDKYAHISSFVRDPETVWKMFKEIYSLVDAAVPNKAHYCLAGLEKMGYVKTIITQNIDGLHQLAGSNSVIEFHGDAKRVVCTGCGKIYDRVNVDLEVPIPTCPRCNSVLKPNMVMWGEPVPPEVMEASLKEVHRCDTALIIGTSSLAYPFTELIKVIYERGARIVEVNPSPTPLTRRGLVSYHLEGKASQVLCEILELVGGYRFDN